VTESHDYYWLLLFLLGLRGRKQFFALAGSSSQIGRNRLLALRKVWQTEKKSRRPSLDWSKLEDETAHLLEELREKSIDVLTLASKMYPVKLRATLGEEAPPILFVYGNPEILHQRSIAIVGSRHCSRKGLELTAKIASFFAENGFNVVSGYASGVDTAAHKGAGACGTTTIVLPTGILEYKLKRSLRDCLSWGNSLVVSEFRPYQRWFVHAAMQRNKTICGLSDAVLVIEARQDGGALQEGLDALKYDKPLYVIRYASPPESARGNEILISKGGIPLASWEEVARVQKLMSSNHPGSVKKTETVAATAQRELAFS
jgi:DNA processing protein